MDAFHATFVGDFCVARTPLGLRKSAKEKGYDNTGQPKTTGSFAPSISVYRGACFSVIRILSVQARFRTCS